MEHSKKNKSVLNNKAFSLAEIMIVLVIIGGIMALILPRIQEGRDNANVRNTKIKMDQIENKINEYQSDCGGKYPSSLDFMVNDTSECQNWTSNKSAKNLLKDEWGNDFVYEKSDKGFNLKSYGKDKKEGGTGPDKDIYSPSSESAQQ